jgi:hypothetical protein
MGWILWIVAPIAPMVEPVDGSQNWQYLACYVEHNDTIEAYPVEK